MYIVQKDCKTTRIKISRNLIKIERITKIYKASEY